MPDRAASLRALVDLLAPTRRTEVVDVGANPIDGDPPYRPLLEAGVAGVTGFEPQPQALARLHDLAGPRERYLPYALGDGGEHTLHVCASSGFTSLFEPDPRQLEALIDFPRLAQVLDRVPVATTRLDEVAEIGAMDLLKIDIQGGELAVFASGRDRLAETVAIQTEVSYHRLYRGQPSAAEIDVELRAQGFVPHRVVAQRDWPLAPIPWADDLQEHARHLVEADLLYVRDPTAMGALTDEQLRHLAIVLVGAYGEVGIALRCALELTRRGAAPADTADALRRLVTP